MAIKSTRIPVPEKGSDEMKTLTGCLNHLVKKGYADNYKVEPEGMKDLGSGKIYSPDQVKVVDFYRFEGISDPADESILYAIETNDGGKGSLVDAFGPFADPLVRKFMDDVKRFEKKQ